MYIFSSVLTVKAMADEVCFVLLISLLILQRIKQLNRRGTTLDSTGHYKAVTSRYDHCNMQMRLLT